MSRPHLEVEPEAADEREAGEGVSRRELSSTASPVCSSASGLHSERRQPCNYTTQSPSSSAISPFSSLNSPDPFHVAQRTCSKPVPDCESVLLATPPHPPDYRLPTVVCPCQPPPVYIQADCHFSIELVCEIDAFLGELVYT